jgi:hypothetical protein
MSKRRRTNPNNKFVMLERWFLATPAWQALPHAARSLYVELELEYKGPESCNNGKIKLSVRQAAERLSCSINFASKMFAELEDKGFIKVNQRGSFSWKVKHSTTWILTKHPCGSRPPTADFMKWQPAPQNLKLGITGKDRSVSRGETENAETDVSDITSVSRGETENADSDPFSVLPHDTVYSLPPLPFEESASEESASEKSEPQSQTALARLSKWPKAQKRFGPWLAARRNELGIQMRDLADVLGIKASDLYDIETGAVGLGGGSQRKAVAYLKERSR